MTYRAAVIGTGPDPDDPSLDGFAMGYTHAQGYVEHPDAELVACADIVRENAEAFATEFDLPEDAVFEDYQEMLAAAEPDIVSITVPPAIHAEIVVDCAESGVPEAVHCEKPMALTWKGCREMAAAADEAGMQLTFNHQRRFLKPFRNAKRLLDEGAIGDLRRVEIGMSNLYDYGSHTFDLCGYFTDQARPSWVLAGIDYRDETLAFGAHNENHATATWKYENGVHGFASTGDGSDVVGCHNRLIGTDGEIVLDNDREESALHVRRDGDGWDAIDCDGEGLHGGNSRAIADALESIDGGPSELRAENALQSTSLIFGAWESVRRRGRVDDPLALDIDDNPLEAMVESGDLNPE
jgi:UDP-N-acetylglucosamine 3-dehydrogenase